jgi:thioesterase domain-containing protein
MIADFMPMWVRPAATRKQSQHAALFIFRNKKQIVLKINDKGSRIPLYLVPSLGLKPGEYSGLVELCDAEQPIYVFQYQLDKYDAASPDLVKVIAAHFVDGVLKTRPNGPVAICAWSAGTIVALEVAQQLRACGRDVALLVAIDWAPENTGIVDAQNSTFRTLRCWFRDEWQSQQSFNVGKYLLMIKQKLFSAAQQEENSQPLMVRMVIEGDPSFTIREKEFLATFYQALHAYVPQEYRGNVLAFVATLEPYKKIAEKWKTIAPSLRTISVKGTHNTIVRGADVKILAARLCEELTVLSQMT